MIIMPTIRAKINADPDDILHTDGRVGRTWPKAPNGKYTLEELQTIVGGMIEMVPLPHPHKGMYLVANENGLSLNMPFNEAASQLAGQCVVGNVLVMRNLKRMG
jgi:hypothetical protein